jgi:hypothetical protein
VGTGIHVFKALANSYLSELIKIYAAVTFSFMCCDEELRKKMDKRSKAIEQMAGQSSWTLIGDDYCYLKLKKMKLCTLSLYGMVNSAINSL